MNAAKRACAHLFISKLADGYGTRIGPGGQSLSGGERQRIALARAFLKDAPILILDEPTSALDQDTESAILDQLQGMQTGKTVFMVSHRARALRSADITMHFSEHGIAVSTGDQPTDALNLVA